MDDLKISHADPAVVRGLIEKLNKRYRTVKRSWIKTIALHTYKYEHVSYIPSSIHRTSQRTRPVNLNVATSSYAKVVFYK